MIKIQNKTVTFELAAENITQIFEDKGYQVKIRTSKFIDEYNNVTELDFSIIQCLQKSKNSILVEKTCLYLKNNICNKFILDDIAIFMGANRSKLSASFKQELGVGVFKWLRKQRMQKAKYLLMSSELSIQSIGFEVGYENSANFSSAYKKQFNLSPRQQRNLSKDKKKLLIQRFFIRNQKNLHE